MAFSQGLSGLSSSAKALDVISHNVANASTVGFKSSTAVFGDVYASAMIGATSNNQVGLGSAVNAVRQSFVQGAIAATNNPLDMAISGNGFFVMQRTDGSTAYTRNGQFDVDRDGNIVNATGDKLTGFPVLDATVVPAVFGGTVSPLYVDTTHITPRATSSATLGVNFDSTATNPRDMVPPGPNIEDYLDATSIPVESYNFTTSIDIYDSLGNQSILNLFLVRNPAVDGVSPNTWSVYSRLSSDVRPGEADPSVSIGRPLELLGTVNFTDRGVLDTTDPANGIFELTRTAAELGTGAADLTFSLDLSRSTQWNAAFGITTAPWQDGYTTGRLTGVSVSAEGVVRGSYSNGASKDIGKIALAEFRAPQGLISIGDNLWAESYDSGQPAIGAPGTGVLGLVSSNRIEESNVDLTQELVNMIVQQRNYQANAQTIRTQDQILQTLVNLR